MKETIKYEWSFYKCNQKDGSFESAILALDKLWIENGKVVFGQRLFQIYPKWWRRRIGME